MTKNKAIVKFCVICVLVALGIVLTFVGFRIPFTNGATWVGSIGAIETRLGIDLRGGVLAVFEAEGNPSPAEMDATVRRLENSLNSLGFVESQVMRQGTNQIRVEVPGLDDADELIRLIGTPAIIEFRSSRNEADTFLSGRQHIESVSTRQLPTFDWVVVLNFTTAGGNAFREGLNTVQNDPTNTMNQIFIFSNGQEISAPRADSPSIGAGNTIQIESPDFRTQAAADALRLQIESGLYEVMLTISEQAIIQPTLGQGALLAGIIAFAVGLAFIFIFMYLLYGHMGLLSNLAMLVFSVLFLFALAIAPMVQLTLPGIAGIILALAMAVDANIIIFERIKDEFKAGKKMTTAVENGFKKSFWTIFDANITTIIAATVLYFLGTGPIQGFAITLLLGVVISMFCSLFVLRQFAKLYLYINSTNAKKLRLKQTKTLNEVEQTLITTTPVKKERKLKGV